MPGVCVKNGMPGVCVKNVCVKKGMPGVCEECVCEEWHAFCVCVKNGMLNLLQTSKWKIACLVCM